MRLSYDFLKNLEKKYGDSFYLLDVNKLRKNFKDFLNAFKKIYPNVKIAYSYKTNYTPFICKEINKLGGFAEVVSEMEYDLAVKIGVKPQNIIVNGPFKPKKALEKFLISGSLVNIDSYREFKYILELAERYKNKTLRIGFRVNFEINNLKNSRFGMDVKSKDFMKAFDELNKKENISVECIHCHFPNRDLKSFKDRVEKLFHIVDYLFQYNPPKYIDIGGGFAGKMSEELEKQFSFKIPKYEDYALVIASKFKEKFKTLDIKPTLILEPGTAIVADTMKFVCRIFSIKNIRGKYIANSTGSRFNFSSLCNNLNMPIGVYSNKKGKYYSDIDIAGYTCIEGDYLYKGFSGYISEDDFIVLDNVGSYSIVFKPPFILPNVPIIAVDKDKLIEIKREESIDDILFTFNMGDNVE